MINKDVLRTPILLTAEHNVVDFDCGIPTLNKYLAVHALQNIQNGAARTYVAVRNNKIAGYYTLAYGSVSRDGAPKRVGKGLGNYPVPVLLLARLAVATSEQGKGIGKGLLKDALQRAMNASEIAGLRAVLVHAKNDWAKNFYKKFGFEESPIDTYHLYLLIKDLKKVTDHGVATSLEL